MGFPGLARVLFFDQPDYYIHVAREEVKDFYDSQGWELEGQHFRDALINENLTSVASDYVCRVRSRIKNALDSGEYLLDVGSGPIQYKEYLEYSQNFSYRVCVDLSKSALDRARKKIGSHGIFICGNFLEIDYLEQAPFDGATLINVLYHVEISKQALLIRKILGDLRPGAKLVVVYSNPKSFSAFLTSLIVKTIHFAKSLFFKTSLEVFSNPIYFERNNLSFWKQFNDEADVEIRAWRTFSPALEKFLFRKFLGGHLLLRILYKLENTRYWYLVSEYQMIVLRKRSDMDSRI